jgi:hypothetical protein
VSALGGYAAPSPDELRIGLGTGAEDQALDFRIQLVLGMLSNADEGGWTCFERREHAETMPLHEIVQRKRNHSSRSVGVRTSRIGWL